MKIKTGVSPILRWAGGKQYIRARLLASCPLDVASRRYFEPFLGAASLFLLVQPRKAFLADANPHLISAYDFIRRDPLRVARILQRIARSDSAAQYYKTRSTYNRSSPSFAQAARFVYLNRTCFNGIFRVNRRGEFNVPYGHRRKTKIPSSGDLIAFGKALSYALLSASDFRESLYGAREGDFVYLDPPYPPLNGTSYFTHYTAERFGETEQRQLSEIVRDLDARGCQVLMSNADTPLVRRLYRGFCIEDLSVTRYITCKAQKHRVRELVIRNYELPGAQRLRLHKERNHA